MEKYVGDFETQKKENKMKVWGWGLYNIETEKFLSGNSIESFIEKIKKIHNPIIYMHNLKFDGSYIINYLFEHGYCYIKNIKEKKDNSFSALINQNNQVFYITIFFKVGNKQVEKVTFYDSYKIIPLSVSVMSEAFGIKEKKLKIDYAAERQDNHILTDLEKNYIKNDCSIVGQSLKYFFNTSLDRMTLGANAMKDFKNTIGRSRFIKYFPYINKSCDNDLRKAFQGGFLYLNPDYKNIELKDVTILDKNSQYPSIMRNEFLPIYQGIFFTGEYQQDNYYPLYIQSFTCSYKIKKDKLPFIKLNPKTTLWQVLPGEYSEDSDGNIINLVMTNVDLELFFEHYDVEDLSFISGWKFRAGKGLFNKYIDKWGKIKEESLKTQNYPMKTISKFMLNYLFGKFSTRIENVIKEPYIDEKEKKLKFKKTTGIAKEGVYLPVSIFVTSYARRNIISTAQQIIDYSLKKYGINKYIYSDTDSLHTTLSIEELKEICQIDQTKLGYWKHEGTYKISKYVKLKTYCNKKDNKFNVVCSGMSKNCLYYKKLKIGKTNNKKYKKIDLIQKKGISQFYKKNNLIFKTLEMTENGKEIVIEKIFTLDKFENGFTVYGKLKAQEEEGGINLLPGSFTISDKNIIDILKKRK